MENVEQEIIIPILPYLTTPKHNGKCVVGIPTRIA